MRKIILVLVLLLILSSSAAAFEVVIQKRETVESAQIYLGEIAAINAAELNAAQLAELKKMELSRSPQLGYQKLINRVLVELSIKNLGYQSSDFKLKMPKQIRVERKSSFIKLTKVKSFVEKKLGNELQLEADKIVIKELNNPEKYQISAGDYRLQLAANSDFEFGRNNIALEVIQQNKAVKRIYYRFELGVKKEVFEAKKDLAYNSPLKKSDFKKVEKLIYQNPKAVISSWKTIAGKELKTTVKKGDYLSYQLIKNPYLVQWGDKVKVTIVKNNVVLSSFVVARGRGKMGDEITVENENSGYRFQAEVISENEVKYISP